MADDVITPQQRRNRLLFGKALDEIVATLPVLCGSQSAPTCVLLIECGVSYCKNLSMGLKTYSSSSTYYCIVGILLLLLYYTYNFVRRPAFRCPLGKGGVHIPVFYCRD